MGKVLCKIKRNSKDGCSRDVEQQWEYTFKNVYNGLGWVAQLVGESYHTPKGRMSNSGSGHIMRLGLDPQSFWC